MTGCRQMVPVWTEGVEVSPWARLSLGFVHQDMPEFRSFRGILRFAPHGWRPWHCAQWFGRFAGAGVKVDLSGGRLQHRTSSQKRIFMRNAYIALTTEIALGVYISGHTIPECRIPSFSPQKNVTTMLYATLNFFP
ncbi:hypothetical protein [Oryzibacter oryziterrae]|uniref:hypothetical protein n=1 Tax=Oryzibacter oryziterrae TaxID=2766474 RepID=UPI001F3C0526|nr:hypothetical protein [Oryzibacter oryziterrae]